MGEATEAVVARPSSAEAAGEALTHLLGLLRLEIYKVTLEKYFLCISEIIVPETNIFVKKLNIQSQNCQ